MTQNLVKTQQVETQVHPNRKEAHMFRLPSQSNIALYNGTMNQHQMQTSLVTSNAYKNERLLINPVTGELETVRSTNSDDGTAICNDSKTFNEFNEFVETNDSMYFDNGSSSDTFLSALGLMRSSEQGLKNNF